MVLSGLATLLLSAAMSWYFILDWGATPAEGAVFAGLAGMLLVGTIAVSRGRAWGAALVGVGMAATFVVFLVVADSPTEILVLLYLLAVGTALAAAVGVGMARAENA